MADEFLSEKNRAEDILLGALGYGEDASITTVRRRPDGYEGEGRYSDGEEFRFEYSGELTELEQWALRLLSPRGRG